MKTEFTIDPDLLPALDALRRVAEAGSFTQAAAALDVSTSALSQTVRRLESALGVQLLARTTRQVSATEAGEALLAVARPGLDALYGAMAEVGERATEPRGTLRVTASRVAYQSVLQPVLGDFLSRYPRIELEVSVDDGLSAIVADRFDVGIRFGERVERDMVGVPIGPARRIAVVGSAGYLQAHGIPDSPDALRGHRCIRYRFPSSGALYDWEFVEPSGAIQSADVTGGFIANDVLAMVEAAKQGVGLAHVLEDLITEDVAAGHLVRVLEAWCPPMYRFHLYFPRTPQMPGKLRVFIDFLRAHSDREGGAPTG
ncbi:LysR family transcriptional regulator [Ralstonia mojiangensis]|uniref:LysR family transcriptional regulator n=1 Tax=Ralstonia mojiangensis TaxID=2953895 RepID=A0AAE3L9Y2_9RALS|nr:LysR family transcriptional regulator [Ralstonia mojiangensis]MCO5412219.1 LysR family transcriptional regulator [Ralstonia mojiangensis]MCT7311036.1 LysR family transcriptional regulator [Ralstonia mojiangensis]MCT7315168.1 LysR family transcriptional regulator [Ralstonia mojiangensis]MCT7325975.1 LysR family transcriptional regulator [Ralstonia mojiangensis]